jgi:hypothetical protein
MVVAVCAIGDNVAAENGNFFRPSAAGSRRDWRNFDELGLLRKALEEAVVEPERDVAVVEVAKSSWWQEKEDRVKAIEHLKSAGKWSVGTGDRDRCWTCVRSLGGRTQPVTDLPARHRSGRQAHVVLLRAGSPPGGRCTSPVQQAGQRAHNEPLDVVGPGVVRHLGMGLTVAANSLGRLVLVRRGRAASAYLEHHSARVEAEPRHLHADLVLVGDGFC